MVPTGKRRRSENLDPAEEEVQPQKTSLKHTFQGCSVELRWMVASTCSVRSSQVFHGLACRTLCSLAGSAPGDKYRLVCSY